MVHAIRALVCSSLAVLVLSGAAWAGNLNVKSAIVMDMGRGTVLYEQDPHRKIAPASLTKVMTMYIVWELIEQKKATLNDKVKVSVRAANTGGSTMNLKAGEIVTISDLMYGMAVASGNDACVAIAEHFGGIPSFVARMNRKAKALGMKDTVYQNPNGLPAGGQVTTARDQLVLAAAYLKRFPNSLKIHSTRSITHNKYTRTNSNRLLGSCPGVDGLKTGFVRSSGFNIIVTAKRNNKRLIAVVLGGQSWAIRNREAANIINACFTGTQPKTTLTAQVSVPAAGLANDVAALELPAQDPSSQNLAAQPKPATTKPGATATAGIAAPASNAAKTVDVAEADVPPDLDQDDVVVDDSDIPDDEDMAEAAALADLAEENGATLASAEQPAFVEVASVGAAFLPALPSSRPTPSARLLAAQAKDAQAKDAQMAAQSAKNAQAQADAANAAIAAAPSAEAQGALPTTPVHNLDTPPVRAVVANAPAGPAPVMHVAALADQIVATSPYEIRGSIERPAALDPVAVPRGLPQPAAIAKGVYYSIQESSWKDRDGAVDHTTKLRQTGLDARVITVQLKQKGTWHRVVIGSFDELQAARQFRAQLKKNHHLDNTLIIQMDAGMEQNQASR